MENPTSSLDFAFCILHSGCVSQQPGRRAAGSRPQLRQAGGWRVALGGKAGDVVSGSQREPVAADVEHSMTDVLAASRDAAENGAPLPLIRSVAILGAGTMGAQIAAHFANAGVPSLLLDLTADLARQGLERARTLKPDPFFTADRATLISTAGLDTDFQRIADADWTIEAIVERLDAKRDLLERVDAVRRPGSIVSSNTSGIPISALAEGRSDDFRRHLIGTHFFNPPRYLRLLEVVPTPDTDPAVVSAVVQFADHRLGKGTVIAKDTPNFIANHIALYNVIRTLEALQ